MPGPEEILEAAIVVTLTAAMFIFFLLIAAKIRRGSRIKSDFTLLLWAFIIGWLGAEVLELLSPQPFDLVARVIHFLVILLFSVFLALRWRWAIRAAMEGAHT